MLPLATLLLAAVALLACESSARVVNTRYGQVDGNTVVLDDGTSIDSFYGIPYARAPIGDLRFAPPRFPDSWTGIFNAKELPNICVQDPVGIVWLTHPLWAKYDEDCLNVNIFTPSDQTGAPFPVMVFFHGGAYNSGGNIQYPGHFLAAKGVVMVSVNYRLAAFGFVATPDGTIRGNMGLYDQSLALRFVRDNIAYFGGDPKSVTIFGQSAGAGSTALQQTSPFSVGLFHRAIQESGTEQNLWSLNYPPSNPEAYVYQLAEKTNCTRPTDPEMVDCLRSVSAADIRKGQELECTPGYFCLGFAPIVDGPGGFIPRLPKDIKEGLGSLTVPVINGICRDDGAIYTPVFIPEAMDGGFNSTEFDYYLRTRLVGIYEEQLTPEQADDAFEASHYNYAPYPYLEDEEGNRQAFNQMITDAAFGYPWDRSAKTNSEFNENTYAYVEAFRSLNASTFIPEWMGVPHMGELPYVFGYPKLLNNQAVRDDCGIHYDVIGWTPEDIPYSDFHIELFTNFAKYSNPTPTPVKSPFNDTMITWEKFSWDTGLKVLYLDAEVSTKSQYDQRDYAFWREYMSYIIDRPVKHTGSSKTPREGSNNRFQFNSKAINEQMKRFVLEALATANVDIPEDIDDY